MTSTVNRRQLGQELKRLREARGLEAKDVAEYLGCSHTRVSRLETGKGRVALKPGELERLCEFFGVTDPRQIERLVSMIPNRRQPGWWDEYRESLPSGLETLLDLETDARSVRAWEPNIIHGLLQTADYARAILSAWPGNRPHDIDDLVQVREKRQELLVERPDREPLELWAIIDEGALGKPVGGRDVMADQIRHLITMAERPNVTLQVVPNLKGAHPGLGGPFSAFELEDNPPVIYVDSPLGNLFQEKPTEVRRFGTTFDLLRAAALDPAESTALLEEAVKRHTTTRTAR